MAEPTRATELLSRYERQFWLLAVVLFGVGDFVLTGFGLVSGGIVEVGPVGAPIVRQYGLWGMAGLKIVVLGAGYLGWRFVPAPERVGIPFGLAVVGGMVSTWNLVVLGITHW